MPCTQGTVLFPCQPLLNMKVPRWWPPFQGTISLKEAEAHEVAEKGLNRKMERKNVEK